MRPFCMTWLLAIVAAAGSAAGEEGASPTPYLALDAGGHTASVSKVRFTPDGQRLVTASTDKTLRVWDLRSGECLDVLRPPRGDGLAGILHAVAISPDGRWLAAGGFEYPGVDHGIYLVDLPQRRIANVLRGHTNVILDLAFSRNGRLLASAAADSTARLWDLATLQNLATLRGHTKAVYSVAFSPDDRQLATASLDHTARLWSVSSASPTATLRSHQAPLQAIAWSGDGEKIATGCVDESVYLWSAKGDLLRRFEKLGNHVTSLRFTRDSRELFFTLGGGGDKDGGFFLDLTANRLRGSFRDHADSVLDGDLSPDGSLAATADASGEVCVWRTKNASLVYRLRSARGRPWSAAWDSRSDTIAWGHTSRYLSLNERGPLELAFSLRELELTGLDDLNLVRARTSHASVSLKPLDAATVVVSRPGSPPMPLRLKGEHDEVRCFTLLDEQTAAVGSDFGLFLFELASGHQGRSFQGHTGAVWAVAPSRDGQWLLSAGNDQTLKIWSSQNGRLLLSLFFADRDWIAWTPQGYYAASPGGERLMGWHVNRGVDQLGAFYPAAQFRRSLYQPEVIRRLLEFGSVPQALAAVAQERGREEQVTTVDRVLPPVVRITEPTQAVLEVTQPQLTVRAVAQARGLHALTAMRLLLDGRPYEGHKGVQVVALDTPPGGDVRGEWTVTLTPGSHFLAVQAETQVSRGLSDRLEVQYRPAAESPRQPDLYVLAAGIAEYPGPLALNYAAKDAQVLADTLRQVSGPLFRRVQVQLLTDAKASRRGIMSGLSWLRKEMTQQDVTVIFFSGHGARDETGNFYLVPSDGDPADLLASAVSGNQFKEALAEIPGRVLVLLDACHAGAAGGDRRKGVYVLADDLVRDLVTDDYGVVVMCSSMGREFSRESAQHKQGYFTLALVEALSGKADYNQDGLVYLTEMDGYVSDRVKTLTLGQQHPVTTKPATIRSFPLSKP